MRYNVRKESSDIMFYPFHKCELHLHLDGSLEAKDAWEIAHKYHIETGYDTYEAYEKHSHVDQNCNSLYDYLACFDVPLTILQYKQALQECAYRLGKRLASQHVLYAEIRFAPQQHIRLELTQEDAVQAVLAGIKQVMEEEKITLQLILCMMVLPQDTRLENEETLHLCNSYLNQGVCALDLAGAEGIRPMEEFSDLFEQAKELGIPFTIHAGENGYPEHIKTALSYGAKRIGHGVHIIYDQALLKECSIRKVPLELCYTSNLQCHVFKDEITHPIRQLFDAGIPISINTDNASISHTSLDQEYEILMREFNFTIEELHECNQNALRSAFLSDEKKASLMKILNESIIA